MNVPDAESPTRGKSRRDFIKGSTAVAATSVLAGIDLPQCHAAEDSTIKLGLVGCGGRGTGAVGNALSTQGGPVKLTAMGDLFDHRLNRSLNRLKNHQDKIDVPPDRQFLGFDSYKKVIDSIGPGGVVILTTHAAFRPMMFEYAVKKGVNVFAEKSFATDGPNTRRWLKAAELSEQKGLKVGVGFMWRHSHGRQEVIKRIHDGEIGELQTIRIYRVHGPVHCPKRKPEENEIKFMLQHPNSFNWVSSGFFIDWHCHNVDVACWTKGAWPVKAQGFGGRCYPEAGNQFDHYTVEYTFPDGGKLFAFSRHMKNCWNTYSDYAHGTKGTAVLMTALGQPKTRIYKTQDMEPENLVWRYPGQEPNPYVVEWQLLLDAIRENKPHNEARRAGEAEIAALMGRIATHTGKEVSWDQVMNSNFQFIDDIDNLDYDTPAPISEGPDGLYPAPTPGITVEV